MIVGIVAAVVVALVAGVVLVVVNRGTDVAGPTVAGSGGTTAPSTAQSPGAAQSPSTAQSPTPTDQSAGSPGAQASVVTIGSRSAVSSSSSGSGGQPQSVTAVASSSTSTAADSVDDQGNPISYAPAKAVDGDPATAWRATSGDGVGQELVLQLPAQYSLTSVGLVPGYNKVDDTTGKDRFRQNRRISRVTWTFDDGSSVAQDFKDDRTAQTIPVHATTSTVRIRIISSLPPDDATDPRDFIAISEVSLQGVSN